MLFCRPTCQNPALLQGLLLPFESQSLSAILSIDYLSLVWLQSTLDQLRTRDVVSIRRSQTTPSVYTLYAHFPAFSAHVSPRALPHRCDIVVWVMQTSGSGAGNQSDRCRGLAWWLHALVVILMVKLAFYYSLFGQGQTLVHCILLALLCATAQQIDLLSLSGRPSSARRKNPFFSETVKLINAKIGGKLPVPQLTIFSSAWLCQKSSWNRNSCVVRPCRNYFWT